MTFGRRAARRCQRGAASDTAQRPLDQCDCFDRLSPPGSVHRGRQAFLAAVLRCLTVTGCDECLCVGHLKRRHGVTCHTVSLRGQHRLPCAIDLLVEPAWLTRMKWGRGMRVFSQLRVFGLIFLVLFASACGGEGAPEGSAPPAGGEGAPESSAPPAGGEGAPPAGGSGGAPPAGGSGGDPDYYTYDEVPGLADYIERCRKLDRDFEEANIVYDRTERMRRGDAKTIEVAVTLRTEVPPQQVLNSEGAIGSRVRVSCVVEAELRGAGEEFGIQEAGWQTRSLLTSPTARWTWSVTPKRGGGHELVFAVRPVITLKNDIGYPILSPQVEASEQTYRITVDVSVSPDQWLAEGFDRVGSVFTSAKGMIATTTALLGAIVTLRLIISRKRPKPPTIK